MRSVRRSRCEVHSCGSRRSVCCFGSQPPPLHACSHHTTCQVREQASHTITQPSSETSQHQTQIQRCKPRDKAAYIEPLLLNLVAAGGKDHRRHPLVRELSARAGRSFGTLAHFAATPTQATHAFFPPLHKASVVQVDTSVGSERALRGLRMKVRLCNRSKKT